MTETRFLTAEYEVKHSREWHNVALGHGEY